MNTLKRTPYTPSLGAEQVGVMDLGEAKRSPERQGAMSV